MPLFWLRVAVCLYGVGLLDGISSLLTRRTRLLSPTLPAIVLGAVFHFVALAELFFEEHQPAVTASHELESLLAFSLTLFFIGVYWRYKTSSPSIFVLPLVFVLSLSSAVGRQPVQFSSPLLRSGWILLHIALILAGYSGLIISMIASLLYLAQERTLKKKLVAGIGWLPSLDTLDRISWRTLALGFPFMTGGLILGAIFAQIEFGVVFLRDPKILLSVLLWLVYIVLLYTRWNSGWRGRRAAFLSTFVFVLAVTAWAANYVSQVHRFTAP